MATYRNKKTGAIITTDLTISGDDWQKVEEKKKTVRKPAKTKKDDE